jgi:hypothetical protein
MAFYPNITHAIGQTPLIGLPHLTADLPATIALKGEFFNPLGSVKDRIGLAMIEAAERAERIGPGSHIAPLHRRISGGQRHPPRRLRRHPERSSRAKPTALRNHSRKPGKLAYRRPTPRLSKGAYRDFG